VRENVLKSILNRARIEFENKFQSLEIQNRGSDKQLSSDEMCQAAREHAERFFRAYLKNHDFDYTMAYDDPILEERMEDLRRGFTKEYLEVKKRYDRIKKRTEKQRILKDAKKLKLKAARHNIIIEIKDVDALKEKIKKKEAEVKDLKEKADASKGSG
jgi:hypothetical protein